MSNINIDQVIHDELYLRILLQLAIEKMDSLKGSSIYNGPGRVKMNDAYQFIDKRCSGYNELFDANEIGTKIYYQAIATNIENILGQTLPEQSVIAMMCTAYNADEKSVLGIVKKVISKIE